MTKYKVKLNMSEEYIVEANNKNEAEQIARGKFGSDYYIDNVDVTEINKKTEIRTVSPAES